jgi:hypothetical protein
MSLKAEEAATQVTQEVKAPAEKVDHKEPRMIHAPNDRNIADQKAPTDNPWLTLTPIGNQLTKVKTAQMEKQIRMNLPECPTRRMMIE